MKLVVLGFLRNQRHTHINIHILRVFVQHIFRNKQITFVPQLYVAICATITEHVFTSINHGMTIEGNRLH